MFNAPRPIQPYGRTTSNGLGASFVDVNPLASSAYDGLDPWSAAPSPSPPPVPSGSGAFGSVIGEASVPAIYNQAYGAVDPTSTGEISVNALSRVLGTSSLPAATIDRIVNLVSSRPRVSKLEFYVALALVALAQSGADISVEHVAVLAQQNTLPEPKLDLSALQPSTSDFSYTRKDNIPPISGVRAYSSDDPWSTAKLPATPGSDGIRSGLPANGASSSIAGSGMPREWWKKQESVGLRVMGQQGFILNRYTVYEITSERGPAVPRRYSEFVFLWDCLVHRYPFRLLPSLPPKRIGPDENFIEQRRRGLARFLSFVINHPVIKEDGLLAVFLTEPHFDVWRKQTPISMEEESVSKRVDKIEEMTIPSDLEEKLATVRGKIGHLIEQWQKICILTERIVKRRESAAVRLPHELRRTYLPSHFASSLSSGYAGAPLSPVSSVLSGLTFAPTSSDADAGQSDVSRLTNTLRALAEVNDKCWRGDECELCEGVRQGVTNVAGHTQRHSDMLEQRTQTMLYTTLEALKSQRDLYIAMRDLFIRHDRFSVDQVEKLKKRVDSNSSKLEGVRGAQKEGWQDEADRIAGLIQKDQATIASLLNRRVFIRACMWHELRVVLHNRENTLLTQAVRQFAREEHDFADRVASNWASLVDAVDSMPLE
ncbi:hypothetical protein JAAARDRAFT_172106 [Jaapia argillacea MUCL 33604]|uniref:Sorting nexin MVP1 n=1 Tax=Jaapia argillacea MUCL 33604 TaxID=933084 RepID=A0A067QDY7_9AGAM|nr:hypothetical protein JAAARDRAFT_172106 [Jaapia argillacea MUCL 33604]